MVNVQNNKEFVCQALNRDVWSHDGVKAVVKDHFVFWQVGLKEGLRVTYGLVNSNPIEHCLLLFL